MPPNGTAFVTDSEMSRILIVDDEEQIRRLCQTALQSAGFEAWAVESAAEALKFLAEDAVDLIVTDIVMPDMDGIELIQTTRSRFPAIAIVAISGGGVFPAKDCLDLARKLGANAVLPKPFGLAELVRIAKETLNGRSIDRDGDATSADHSARH